MLQVPAACSTFRILLLALSHATLIQDCFYGWSRISKEVKSIPRYAQVWMLYTCVDRKNEGYIVNQ